MRGPGLMVGTAFDDVARVPKVLAHCLHEGRLILMNAGTFACIIAMRRQGRNVEGVGDLAGLGRTDPALALALAVAAYPIVAGRLRRSG